MTAYGFHQATYQLTAEKTVIGSLFMETGVDDADYQNEIRFIAEQAKNDDNHILGSSPHADLKPITVLTHG